MPVLVATFHPRPEHRDEVIAALKVAIAQVHEEPGCHLYALHEAPGALVLIEDWESDEALAVHGAAPALAELGKRLDGTLEGRPELVVLAPIPAGDPVRGQLRR
jgi:quinol monooxygenase YgiN